MSGGDTVRLFHIRDAAREALAFLDQRKREDLDSDRMLALAVFKELEIIGEPAGRVSQPTRDQLPDIPWAEIGGMRNRLIHAYFDVKGIDHFLAARAGAE